MPPKLTAESLSDAQRLYLAATETGLPLDIADPHFMALNEAGLVYVEWSDRARTTVCAWDTTGATQRMHDVWD